MVGGPTDARVRPPACQTLAPQAFLYGGRPDRCSRLSRHCGCDTDRLGCYTTLVPTTRPRYTVTDTGNLREQLDQAQRRWPDVHDRRQLLLRLVTAGQELIEREAMERGAAVRETAGSLTGVYRPGELARLREDWPV